MPSQNFRGVLVPVLTPFRRDLTPDADKFVAFCRGLIDQGADGLAVFGTTSEANSIGAEERMGLLERLVEGGVPAAKLMPGTGATSIEDAVRLANHAAKLGCGGVLMLPPFYYKGMPDDGIFDFFKAVLDRVDAPGLKVYLYHIPPVAQVGFSLDLIDRLIKAYPDTIVGLKDSSGDWANTKAIIERFPGFAVFAGSEVFLLDTLRAGGAGCITATGSVNVPGIRKIFANWEGADADALQARATEIRKVIQAYPVVPALKVIVAHFNEDDTWRTVRPPMVELPAEQRKKLIDELKAINFRLEGALARA